MLTEPPFLCARTWDDGIAGGRLCRARHVCYGLVIRNMQQAHGIETRPRQLQFTMIHQQRTWDDGVASGRLRRALHLCYGLVHGYRAGRELPVEVRGLGGHRCSDGGGAGDAGRRQPAAVAILFELQII